jgi:hypothetical protein
LNEPRTPELNHIYKTRSIHKKIIPSKYCSMGKLIFKNTVVRKVVIWQPDFFWSHANHVLILTQKLLGTVYQNCDNVIYPVIKSVPKTKCLIFCIYLTFFFTEIAFSLSQFWYTVPNNFCVNIKTWFACDPFCFWDWLYHGVYQVSRNGELDMPRDKVSPKNKMSNILFIGNL